MQIVAVHDFDSSWINMSIPRRDTVLQLQRLIDVERERFLMQAQGRGEIGERPRHRKPCSRARIAGMVEHRHGDRPAIDL